MDNTTGITIEEFYDYLWEEVSDSIVPTLFLHNNQEFINSVTFDLYRIHNMTNGLITVRHLARIVESMMSHYMRLGINL